MKPDFLKVCISPITFHCSLRGQVLYACRSCEPCVMYSSGELRARFLNRERQRRYRERQRLKRLRDQLASLRSSDN